MADYNASLPVRTENNGDVVTKVCDSTIPSQQLTITAAGEAEVTLTTALPAGTNNIGDVDVLTQPARSAGTDSITAWIVDESGNAFTEANPFPTYVSDQPGDPIHDYNTSAALAAGGTSNHDYTVSVGKTLYVSQILAAASGKLKIEVQEETSIGSGTYNSKAVMFSSASDNNCSVEFKIPLEVETGKRLRVIRTNRDNQSQDVYSTVVGIER